MLHSSGASAGQSSCDRSFVLRSSGEWLAHGLHQIIAGNVITKLSISFQSSGVVATLEIFFMTVTDINIKKVQKQDLKKNVKGYRDGVPKSMETR